MKKIRKLTAAIIAVISILCLVVLPSSAALPSWFENLSVTPDSKMELKADGNRLVNGYGETVRLFGSNFTMDEYDKAARSWSVNKDLTDITKKRVDFLFNDFGANCARVVIDIKWWNNEDAEISQLYRDMVDYIVKYAVKKRAYVWIDLHSGRYGCLPDAECEDFWIQVANKYKNHPNVLFGLFNEPIRCNWEQWYNGTGDNPISGYNEVPVYSKGIQNLVKIIRETGANNLLIADTIYYSSYFDGIVSGKYALKDTESGNGIMYDPHIYSEIREDNEMLEQLAEKYPVIIGEVNSVMGHDNMVVQMDYDFFDNFFKLAETLQLSYCSWAFSCNDNSWDMLKWSDYDKKEITYSVSGKYFSDRIKAESSQKSVQLVTPQGEFTSFGGKYSADDVMKSGIKLGEISKITRTASFKSYKINLYSEDNYSGKCFTVYNKCDDLKSAGLTFEPKSVEIIDSNMNNKALECEVYTSSGSETAKYITDGTSESWSGAADETSAIIIDLKDVYDVTDIFLWTTSAESMSPKDYSLSLSTDGFNYTRVYDVTGNNDVKSYINIFSSPARYLRMIITKGNETGTGITTVTEIGVNGYKYSGSSIKTPVKYSYLEVGGNNSDGNSNEDNQVIDSGTYIIKNNDTDPMNPNGKQVIKKILRKRLLQDSYTAWIIAGVTAGVLIAGGTAAVIVIKKKKRKVVKSDEA